MVSHIINRSRTIVQAIRERSNLIIGAVLRNFFKGTMYVTNGGYAANNPLPIHLHHVLKNAVSSRVCGANIDGHQLVLRIIICKNGLVTGYSTDRLTHSAPTLPAKKIILLIHAV